MFTLNSYKLKQLHFNNIVYITYVQLFSLVTKCSKYNIYFFVFTVTNIWSIRNILDNTCALRLSPGLALISRRRTRRTYLP